MTEDSEVAPEEGWYTDPFGAHEARWMSAGSPTKLVRDGPIESYDEPPEREPTHRPIPIEEFEGTRGPAGGRDLLRADESESGSLHERIADMGEFGGAAGSHVILPDMEDEEERDERARDVGRPGGVG